MHPGARVHHTSGGQDLGHGLKAPPFSQARLSPRCHGHAGHSHLLTCSLLHSDLGLVPVGHQQQEWDSHWTLWDTLLKTILLSFISVLLPLPITPGKQSPSHWCDPPNSRSPSHLWSLCTHQTHHPGKATCSPATVSQQLTHSLVLFLLN